MGGKLSVLGFFGVCPNVEVGVPRLDHPTFLTFLVSGDAGEGSFTGAAAVVDEANERVIGATADMPFTALPNRLTVLAPTLMLVFGRSGQYSLRVFVNQQEQFRATFRVIQGATEAASTAYPA